MNFFPGELILELLARIGEWHQNLSEKTASPSRHKMTPARLHIFVYIKVTPAHLHDGTLYIEIFLYI